MCFTRKTVWKQITDSLWYPVAKKSQQHLVSIHQPGYDFHFPDTLTLIRLSCVLIAGSQVSKQQVTCILGTDLLGHVIVLQHWGTSWGSNLLSHRHNIGYFHQSYRSCYQSYNARRLAGLPVDFQFLWQRWLALEAYAFLGHRGGFIKTPATALLLLNPIVLTTVVNVEVSLQKLLSMSFTTWAKQGC